MSADFEPHPPTSQQRPRTPVTRRAQAIFAEHGEGVHLV